MTTSGVRDFCLLVMSGKGGVGKSSVVRGLTSRLSLAENRSIRVLDVDLGGPSMGRLLAGELGSGQPQKWAARQVRTRGGRVIGVMSISFLLESETDAVIWRGPKKCGFIETLVDSVEWPASSAASLTIIDTPPGTSDEHLAIIDALKRSSSSSFGCVLVSTSSLLSLSDVRRQITFCRKTGLPVLGLVENMAKTDDSAIECGNCGNRIGLLAKSLGSVKGLAEETGLDYLGAIPWSERIQMDDGPLEQFDDRDFEQLANSLENKIWGDAS